MSSIADDTQILQKAVDCVRTYIRDKKAINRLLGHEFESTNEELQQSLYHALMDWNTSPPPVGFATLRSHPAKHLLVQCAAINALTSSGIWHSREHMPSSDGSTSGDDHAKAAEYSGWIQNLTADYEKKKDAIKLAINIAEGYRDMGLSSEYGWNIAGMYW